MSALGVCAPGRWGRADGAGGARVGCAGGTLGTGCTLRVYGVHTQSAQGALSAHRLPAQAPFSLPGWAPPWVRSPRARWSSGRTPQHHAQSARGARFPPEQPAARLGQPQSAAPHICWLSHEQDPLWVLSSPQPRGGRAGEAQPCSPELVPRGELCPGRQKLWGSSTLRLNSYSAANTSEEGTGNHTVKICRIICLRTGNLLLPP